LFFGWRRGGRGWGGGGGGVWLGGLLEEGGV